MAGIRRIKQQTKFKIVSLLLRRAELLVRAHRYRQAIDFLSRWNRRLSAPRLETRLRDLRHEAFFLQNFGPPAGSWPPETIDSFPEKPSIPVIDRARATSDLIRAGVFQRGSIIVRGLLTPSDVALLTDGIRHAYDAHDRHMAGEPTSGTAPWFVPFVPQDRPGMNPEIAREWFRRTGAELAADSPRSLYRLIEVLESNGVIDLVAGFLGERPALSVRKTSLREVAPDIDASNGWHQDGAFLGKGIRTVNVWVALTDCGVDAPSMDMAPRRLTSILPTGTEGATFDWSVSQQVANEACGPDGHAHLEFAAGDAIFFDEMNLHRTSTLPGMTTSRHAIEAWFFAPSCYPLEQLPLLV